MAQGEPVTAPEFIPGSDPTSDQQPDPGFDPRSGADLCPKTGLPIYTRRATLSDAIRDDVEAGFVQSGAPTIRACPSCAGLHAVPRPATDTVTPTSPGAAAPDVSKSAPCRKRRYRTELDARTALAFIRVSDKPKRREKRIYPCPQCEGFWHLSSQERRGK